MCMAKPSQNPSFADTSQSPALVSTPVRLDPTFSRKRKAEDEDAGAKPKRRKEEPQKGALKDVEERGEAGREEWVRGGGERK